MCCCLRDCLARSFGKKDILFVLLNKVDKAEHVCFQLNIADISNKGAKVLAKDMSELCGKILYSDQMNRSDFNYETMKNICEKHLFLDLNTREKFISLWVSTGENAGELTKNLFETKEKDMKENIIKVV